MVMAGARWWSDEREWGLGRIDLCVCACVHVHVHVCVCVHLVNHVGRGVNAAGHAEQLQCVVVLSELALCNTHAVVRLE
jgi:hypothetical protein